MYKGIIFDMDGVLADTESYYTNRRDEYLRLMGYQRQENTDFTGSNEKALWETMVPNDPELRQELLMGYRAYRKLHPIPFRELLDPQAALPPPPKEPEEEEPGEEEPGEEDLPGEGDEFSLEGDMGLEGDLGM